MPSFMRIASITKSYEQDLCFGQTDRHTHTDRHTDRQDKNNMPPISRSWGIKKREGVSQKETAAVSEAVKTSIIQYSLYGS